MAKLIYVANMSVDGYVADEQGSIDWTVPDEEVIARINALERPIGTHLLGRKMYETMAVWEDPRFVADQPPVLQEFAAIWQAADTVVYTGTLQTVSSANTRIERDFDVAAVRQLKSRLSRDISIGGATLAAQAIGAGLVDEYHLFVAPVAVGGGLPALPRHVHLQLELLHEHRCGCGVVHLHYCSKPWWARDAGSDGLHSKGSCVPAGKSWA
jgi:dihydrofolate reductase